MNKFLYKISKFKFLILNVNFLLDQFYKAQIFSFNAFIKGKNIKGEFLSEKGKKFTEEHKEKLRKARCEISSIKREIERNRNERIYG